MNPTNFRVLDQYREESSWADEIGKTYHFPKKYLKLLSQPNTRFIYHEPKRKGKGEYFGCGEIGKITPDPADADQFFAELHKYAPFASPVPDSTQEGKPRELGPYYNPQNAVRKVPPELFNAICSAGGVTSMTHEIEQTTGTATESSSTDPVTAAFNAVCSFCRDYPTNLPGGLPTGDPKAVLAKKNLRIIADWLHGEFPEHNGKPITVKPTAGAGAFPRVPWVCVLPPGQEVTKGIYVGLCFGMEGAGLVAGCMRSVTNRVQLPTVTRTGKEPLAIDVGDFNNAYANPVEIKIENLNQQTLLDHIRVSLDLASNTLARKGEHPADSTPEPPPLPPESISQIPPEQILKDGQDAIEKTGFLSPPGQVRRFLTALAAKPFAILTGNSGTGKTKLAQLIAHWLTGTEDSNHGYAVVPVGADWTDNRNIVGYVNHLRKPDGQNPIYQSAPVLDLLLRAKANSGRPYFLILDEMNLSHVERYLSDFLSAMESKKPVPLHNEKQPLQTAAGTLVHASEPYPDNLFVVGTVNVDETTYMFSPKVLDRANVLEFRIGPEDAKYFLAQADKPMQEIALAAPGTAESFLLLSRRARGLAGPSLDPLAPASLKPSRETLQDLFTLLHTAQLEFAFRTIAEVIRYLHADYALAADKSAWDWKDSLDAQLLQKLLPKLHGSRRRLEGVLVALTVYCEKRDIAAAHDRLKKDADLSNIPALTQPPSIAFPRSRTKLLEMLHAVRRDQFVSFIQ